MWSPSNRQKTNLALSDVCRTPGEHVSHEHAKLCLGLRSPVLVAGRDLFHLSRQCKGGTHHRTAGPRYRNGCLPLLLPTGDDGPNAQAVVEYRAWEGTWRADEHVCEHSSLSDCRG